MGGWTGEGKDVIHWDGDIKAKKFYGNGANLTNLPLPDTSGLVPYTGATNNLDLGEHKLKLQTAETIDTIGFGDSYRYGLGVLSAYTTLYAHNAGNGLRFGFYNGTNFTNKFTLDNTGGIFVGTISASNLSGTNTGDLEIPLNISHGGTNNTSFATTGGIPYFDGSKIADNPYIKYVSGYNQSSASATNITLAPSSGVDTGALFRIYVGKDKLNTTLNALYIGDNSGVSGTRRLFFDNSYYALNFGGVQSFESFPSNFTMASGSNLGLTCSAILSASARNLVLYSNGWGNLVWSGSPTISGSGGTGTSDSNQHRDLAFNSYYIGTDDRAVYTSAFSFRTNQNAAGLAPYYHTAWGIPSSTAGNASPVMVLTNRKALGVGIATKLSALQVQPTADYVALGTTTANASTTITGVSTYFTLELAIGDRISLSSASSTYGIVTAIASDTSLTSSVALGNGTSQTINVKKSITNLTDSSGATALFINDLKSVGIGTIQPTQVLDVNGNINATAYYVGTTAGISATITTAALTTLGSQGSMTFVNGILTAQTPAT